MKIRKMCIAGCLAGILLFGTACGSALTAPVSELEKDDQQEAVQDNEGKAGNITAGASKEVKKEKPEKKLSDNQSLYEDDTSELVTMYLTVSRGAASDNADHTWTEVNSYSAFYYDNLGIDRYGVNGLLQVGDENGPVEGMFGADQYAPNAIVTVRGQTSTRGAQKSYKIRLRDGKGTWEDQQTINLNKHQGDGVRFRNKMYFKLLQDMPNLISLRTRFVHLYVKDTTEGGSGEFKDYGLYTQVEQLNKSALKLHGLDKNGHLYKLNNIFEFYRYEDAIKMKNDADYDKKAFEFYLEIKGDDDHSKLIAMLDDVNDITMPIEDVVDKWFDEDNLLYWLSYQILMGNTDTQSRNAFLYSPLNEDTWYFLCWDGDGAFRRLDKRLKAPGTEFGWEEGISNYWGNQLFQRILKREAYREKLGEVILDVKERLSEEKLEALTEEYAAVTKPFLYVEPDIGHAPLKEEQFEIVCEEIPDVIDMNYQLYLDSHKKPMPFYIAPPVYDKDKNLKFCWDNSYSLEGREITYSFYLASDYKYENPIATKEGIYVPEYTFEGELAPGQYWVRVVATDDTGESQYAFDYYAVRGGIKILGTISFFVMDDGKIVLDLQERKD